MVQGYWTNEDAYIALRVYSLFSKGESNYLSTLSQFIIYNIEVVCTFMLLVILFAYFQSFLKNWLDSHSIDEFVVVGSGCDEAVEQDEPEDVDWG